MKKLKFLLSFIILGFFYGCGTSITNVSTSNQKINEVKQYNGKKVRIAVATFKCKAAKCNGQIGSGISDMLTSALMKTNKFIVLERNHEALNAIQNEINNPMFVSNKHSTHLEGADILVVGAVTAFEPNAGGFGVGGIAIPKNIPLIGGIKFKKKDAYIAIDLRLVDVETGRVLAATTVEAKASDWKIGGLGGGYSKGLILGGGLDVYKNTPMEKAVRILIEKAVKEIEKLTPEEYFRYSSINNPGQNSTHSINQSSSKPISPNNQTLKTKLVYNENFEKYGIGQHTPFGLITGNGFVQLGINKTNQTSKVLVINNNSICINKKLKNFILTFDAKPNEFGEYYIYFRYNRKNKIGYKLHDYDHWTFELFKKTATSESVFAKAKIEGLRKPNKWYSIKVIANDKNIKIFYDNVLIIDVNDNDPYFNKAGQICFKGSHMLIDNIKIYKIIK